MFTKYFESNYSVIPLKPGTKIPFMEGWQQYCQHLPAPEQIEKWEEGRYNMGLCLGPASGVVALDIDTDNTETLRIAPRSPCVKRGAKGETRFFKWKPGIQSRTLRSKGVEILSEGRQTVMPPSVHPETKKPYEWLSQLTLLDIEPRDLPELLEEDIDLLPDLNSTQSNEPFQAGRNDILKSIVSAMRLRGEPEMKIVHEVYNYDKHHHKNRLFTDSKEMMPAENEEDAKANAFLFVSRVTQSLARKKLVLIHDYEEREHVTFDLPKPFEYKAPPKFSGFIDTFSSLSVAASKANVNVISLGGALSVLAAVACNRFRVGSTWPNLYVLNIARSGLGKSTPQQLAHLCLDESGLIGSGNYRSGASMYTYLPRQQERLDIIDEASMLFRAIKKGDSWQTEMQEILCTLFSVSNMKFAGVTLKGSSLDKTKPMTDGACYNPCINILASTTPQGFSESFDLSMSSKGLLPRFLIFNQELPGEWRPFTGFKALEAEVQNLKEFLNDILRIEKNCVLDTMAEDDALFPKGPRGQGRKYDPIDYPIDKNSKDLLNDFDRQYFNLAAQDRSENVGPFYARFCELATKLSLLIALSEAKASIDVECVEKAIDVVIMQFHNSTLLRDALAPAQLSQSDKFSKALKILRTEGKLYSSVLCRRVSKSMTKRQQDDLIDALVASGLCIRVGSSNRSSIQYVDGSADLN